MLPKPYKNPQEVESYRPITLLSCLSKLLEQIIKHRLILFAETHHLFPKNQAGFRKGRCTTDNLLHLTEDVSTNLYHSRKTALVVFDIKQAFDSVWHHSLWFKLKKMGILDYLWQWCKAFLSGRKSLIDLNSFTSETFELHRGTPQGSPLSPLLYILYTSDSLTLIPNHTISNLFADDTALWSSFHRTQGLQIRLQGSIDAFSCWCRLWKLELQGEKTKLIRFTNHPRKKYPPLLLYINYSQIKETDSVKYLAVTFDKSLNFNKRADDICKKTNTRLDLTRYLSKNVDSTGERALLLVYNSLIRSVISYASPIFMIGGKSFWDKMQIIQNKGLRLALHVPPYTSSNYIHQQLNQTAILTYCEHQTNKYLNQAI